MPITTVPGDVYLVSVEGREDGIYAFSAEREAERFVEAVIRNGGGNCYADRVPLNTTPDHTDHLIAAERDSNV